MDRGMVIFLGALLTFTSSWLGLVFIPMLQINKMDPVPVDEGNTTTTYPRPLTGDPAAGKEVYKELGCIYCHSQQIRSETFGNNADIKRGWANRRTVPRDYIYDRPVMLGTMRTGPDLVNIGAGPGKGLRWYAADWHHKHLYDPEMMVPGSKMPKFSFLYEKRKIIGQKSQDALELTGKWADRLGPDEELVPSTDAKALVAYLLSLDHTYDLPEAKE
jgi:cytochrome c oxidase cbb3-type subunit 2